VVEVVEMMESMIPNEAPIIESVEAPEPIISIEVSVAKASEADGEFIMDRGALACVPSNVTSEARIPIRGIEPPCPLICAFAVDAAKRMVLRNQGE